MWQHFELIGSGLYFPNKHVSAEEIDKRAGLPAGWTRQHTGVLNRHECVAPESLANMAREAILSALNDAKLKLNDIDMLIDASTCHHQPIPCNAAIVQSCLGPQARGIPCLDVHSTCLGFVVALNVANGLLATDVCQRVVIVCSEAGLLGVNWNHPESAALMGDGASAVVLQRAGKTPTYRFCQQTFTEHLPLCQIRGGGHIFPPTEYSAETDEAFRFSMNGPKLFRVACKHLPKMARELITGAELHDENRLHIIPHQASPKAVATIGALLRWPEDRYHNRVPGMGNLAAAGIPAVLHQCRQESLICKNDPVLLLGTSAGYSQAGLLFRM